MIGFNARLRENQPTLKSFLREEERRVLRRSPRMGKILLSWTTFAMSTAIRNTVCFTAWLQGENSEAKS